MVTGGRVGHYQVTHPIGAGGMGEVYRAIDTRLQRPVALKLIPDHVVTAGALERFQREARAASSLNHPNIVTVHDVGEHDGRHYLVMELLEGGTLCEWLGAEPRTWRQKIELLIGVADGLAAAHDAGILHRDIKPANILVGRSGHAKLGDFGLAKLIEASEGAGAETRTIGAAPTHPGVVMGTIAYMSPEQAEGRTLDARSDIFSFGVVLYEALSGRGPFPGATGLEVLQKIINVPPEPIGDDIPAAVRFVIEKALEKDPNDRYQSAHEIVVDLRRALRGRGESARHGSPAVVRWPQRRRRTVASALLLAALGTGALLGHTVTGRPARPAVPELRQQRLSELVGMEESPAVSPDGTMLAFVAPVNGRRQIWVRLLAEGAPTRITHDDDRDHSHPRWADAGMLVYYRKPDREGDAGSLWRALVPSSTPPRFIAATHGEADVSHADGTIATFDMKDGAPSLVLIGADGGRTPLPLPQGVYSAPRWSPDDERIAFQVMLDFTATEIQVIERGGGTPRPIVRTSRMRGFAWLPDGDGLVYASSEGSTLLYPPTYSLWTVRIDGSEVTRLPLVDAGYASYVEPDVTPDGALVASRVRLESDIYRYPITGSPSENVRNATRITRQTGQVQVPTVSPDDAEVAYLSDSHGHANVWVARIDGRESPRQLTFERDPETIIAIPRWSPADDHIVYLRILRGEARGGRTFRMGGVGEQRLVSSDGTNDRQLVQSGGGAFWSGDGEWVYYIANPGEETTMPCTERIHVQTQRRELVRCGAVGLQVSTDGSTAFFSLTTARQGEVYKATPVDGEPVLLRDDLQSRMPLWPHQYDLSPDGRWLATPLLDHGTTNLWLISTDDGSLHQVTDFGNLPTLIARQVSWSSDSRHIFAALLEMDADIVLMRGMLP